MAVSSTSTICLWILSLMLSQWYCGRFEAVTSGSERALKLLTPGKIYSTVSPASSGKMCKSGCGRDARLLAGGDLKLGKATGTEAHRRGYRGAQQRRTEEDTEAHRRGYTRRKEWIHDVHKRRYPRAHNGAAQERN